MLAELDGSFRCVCNTLDVGFRSSKEPAERVLLPTSGKQIVCIRIAQSSPPRLLSRRIQVRTLQGDHRSIELTKVTPRPSGDDPQLDRLINV